jgi:hypothetical protein
MKKKLQSCVLVIGIIGSIFAYATTPQVDHTGYPCISYDLGTTRCYIRASDAAVRGGGTLLLAIFAFAGVSVMYKDED